MSLQDEIRRAIGAHGLWKSRLGTAIATGKSEISPEVAGVDHQCEFGKWLHGTSITPAEKTASQYETVRRLHAEFHKTTRQVLTLALSGKRTEAQALMKDSSAYATISADLTREMMRWASAVK